MRLDEPINSVGTWEGFPRDSFTRCFHENVNMNPIKVFSKGIFHVHSPTKQIGKWIKNSLNWPSNMKVALNENLFRVLKIYFIRKFNGYHFFWAWSENYKSCKKSSIFFKACKSTSNTIFKKMQKKKKLFPWNSFFINFNKVASENSMLFFANGLLHWRASCTKFLQTFHLRMIYAFYSSMIFKPVKLFLGSQQIFRFSGTAFWKPGCLQNTSIQCMCLVSNSPIPMVLCCLLVQDPIVS